MGFIDKLVIGGLTAVIGTGIVQVVRNAREEARRKNSVPEFDDRMTSQDFAAAAKRLAKSAPRVHEVTVADMNVKIKVRSVSGLTKWTAELDFNDHGKLSGRYWIRSENDQSPIPEHIANALQAEIERR
ncbi:MULTISPECIES: hypothetical protein [unclassified Rathayibacter]|uniref:hypothetical protein n=1 Tax=unclassified Rathayibacter TaxID=2609250 RepID=UPI0011AFF4F4|nr:MULTISPECIES: hypothetical protein [unclassified Rathayibacter]